MIYLSNRLAYTFPCFQKLVEDILKSYGVIRKHLIFRTLCIMVQIQWKQRKDRTFGIQRRHSLFCCVSMSQQGRSCSTVEYLSCPRTWWTFRPLMTSDSGRGTTSCSSRFTVSRLRHSQSSVAFCSLYSIGKFISHCTREIKKKAYFRKMPVHNENICKIAFCVLHASLKNYWSPRYFHPDQDLLIQGLVTATKYYFPKYEEI